MRAAGTITRSAVDPGSAKASRWALAVGAGGIALFAVGPVWLSAPLFILIVLGSIAATVAGALRNRGNRRVWWTLVGAETTFFAAAIVRIAVPGADSPTLGPATLIPDMIAVPGYMMFGYALWEMRRRRRAADDDSARSDGMLVGLGAALATWTLLIEPQLGGAIRPAGPYLATVFFPLVDVALLVLAVGLVLADGARRPALWLISLTCLGVFSGDVLYAVRQAGMGGDGLLRVLDAVFLVAYVALASASLHPTMRTLTEPQPVTAQPIGALRTAGIAAALVAPSAAAILWPPPSTWAGLVRLMLSSALTLALTARIVSATNSRARAEAQTRYRATHDALTELPNRELLADTLARWCERTHAEGLQISLLFIDLDRFKMVNDSWGHEVGDELLCAVAGRLSAAVREEDLVCRIGGDEFVIALSGASSGLAESLAKRLLEDFARPFDLSIGRVVVTPSIGVARSSGPTEALELVRDADTAMYRAKGAGRNAYAFFDASLRAHVRTRVELEQALRGALERGELSVHYQPIVEPRTGALAGFEALMRWNHPRFGSVSPVDFIPIAEDTGLIVRSGAWLMEQAAAQLCAWRAHRPVDAPDIHMSVNVSMRQLREADFPDVVRGVLERTGLPARWLWLEVTETAEIGDHEVAMATLHALRAMGVTVAVDDFGTGYASLSYLRRFPAGIVKVDRSFVAEMCDSPDDEAIVQAVIVMAHSLGRQVVAEGVETARQRDRLVALGCDLVQGWLYGQPRPPDALTDWLSRSPADGPPPLSVSPGPSSVPSPNVNAAVEAR